MRMHCMYHCKTVLTHFSYRGNLPDQLQLQLSGLHYHGMCVSLHFVVNPYHVN